MPKNDYISVIWINGLMKLIEGKKDVISAPMIVIVNIVNKIERM